jgi:ribulose-5-phosphate 4-epimerase/fuculose-1-phosphate aldolase
VFIGVTRQAIKIGGNGIMNKSKDMASLNRKMQTAITILRWEMGNAWGHVAVRAPDQTHFFLRHIRPPLEKRISDDTLRYDLDGNFVSGKRDLPQEIFFYSVPLKTKTNLGAVIHCHPPGAIALAAVGQKITPIHQDAVRFGKGIPLAPWLYGSLRDHAERAFKLMRDNCAVVIRGHGAVVTGETLEDACMNMVHLERTARMILSAAPMGKVKALSDAEMRHLRILVRGGKRTGSKISESPDPQHKEWRFFESMVESGEQWATI